MLMMWVIMGAPGLTILIVFHQLDKATFLYDLAVT